MAKCYVIADVDKRSNPEPHDSQWPKFIGYSPQENCILMSEGCGHGLSGGIVYMDMFDEFEWKDFFIDVNATWFLDFLKLKSRKFSLKELEDEIKKHRNILVENH